MMTMMTTDASSATAMLRDGGAGKDPRALAERITIKMSVPMDVAATAVSAAKAAGDGNGEDGEGDGSR